MAWLVYAVRNKDKSMIAPLLQWPGINNKYLNTEMLTVVGKAISHKDVLDISKLDVQKNLQEVLAERDLEIEVMKEIAAKKW